MAEPLIRMTNIKKSYGRVQALEDANFHVNEREIVGLLSDNGAGFGLPAANWKTSGRAGPPLGSGPVPSVGFAERNTRPS